MTEGCGAPHGMTAPHGEEMEAMEGQTIVEGADGTPLKVTFEAAGHLETDVAIVQRTSVRTPAITPTGLRWEVAEVDAGAVGRPTH